MQINAHAHIYKNTGYWVNHKGWGRYSEAFQRHFGGVSEALQRHFGGISEVFQSGFGGLLDIIGHHLWVSMVSIHV